MKQEVPIWKKYSLNVKKLYEIIRNNPNADFLLEIGAHYRIKRALFERFLDDATTI